MKNINIKLKTITAIRCANKDISIIYATLRGIIYFIDIHKLEYILSLLEILLEFREYLNKNKKQNISKWLKNKNLLYKELLENISYHKITKNNFNQEKSYFPYDKKLIENYFEKLIKTNIKNIILYHYLKQNAKIFNEYVYENLIYLKNNKNPKENMTYENFIQYLLKIDMLKIDKLLSKIDKIKISSNIETILKNFISIEKVSNGKNTFFETCINENIEINIKIKSINLSAKRLKEYIKSALLLNKDRLNSEMIYILNSMINSKENSSDNIQKIKINEELLDSNFSFLSLEQLFYLIINEKNKKLILKIFSNKEAYFKEKYFYCFRENSDKKSKFLNYAITEYEIVKNF